MNHSIQINEKAALSVPNIHDAWLEQISLKKRNLLLRVGTYSGEEFSIEIPSVDMVVATEFRVHNIFFDLMFYKLGGKFMLDEEDLLSTINGASSSVIGELHNYYLKKNSVIIFECSYGNNIFVTGDFDQQSITWSTLARESGELR
jgi:hypothetical protein